MDAVDVDLSITDEPEHHRYVARVDGHLAGLIAYAIEEPVITMIHTEVKPAYEGRGLAGRLARFALDDTRDRGRRVRPLCPFVSGWIGKHPDYADLVEGGW